MMAKKMVYRFKGVQGPVRSDISLRVGLLKNSRFIGEEEGESWQRKSLLRQS